MPAQSFLNELALALTSGQEIKLAVSAGHVIIWNDLSASLFIGPDDHENSTLEANVDPAKLLITE